MAMSWKTQYNNLMYDIAFEHNTIGTQLSENTNGWNLRDAVSETAYTLELWQDPDSIFYADAHEEYYGDRQELIRQRKMWTREIARMKRFINKYKTEALTMHCTVNHSSDYDG